MLQEELSDANVYLQQLYRTVQRVATFPSSVKTKHRDDAWQNDPVTAQRKCGFVFVSWEFAQLNAFACCWTLSTQQAYTRSRNAVCISAVSARIWSFLSLEGNLPGASSGEVVSPGCAWSVGSWEKKLGMCGRYMWLPFRAAAWVCLGVLETGRL